LRAEQKIFSENYREMSKEKLNFVIAFAAIVVCLGESDGQDLEAKLASAQLPMETDELATVYDGNNIYILGGSVWVCLRVFALGYPLLYI
jgi:hypothetical protein